MSRTPTTRGVPCGPSGGRSAVRTEAASRRSSARPSWELFASVWNAVAESSLRRTDSMNDSMLGVRTIVSSLREQSRSGSSSSSDSSRSAARRRPYLQQLRARSRRRCRNGRPPPPQSRRPGASREPFALERHQGNPSGVRETPTPRPDEARERARATEGSVEQELAEPERCLRRLRVRGCRVARALSPLELGSGRRGRSA